MPKIKTLLVVLLVLLFGISLTGCGLLGSRSPETVIDASLDGELPGWLLLSHRNEVDPNAEIEEVANPKDPLEEEEEPDDLAIGGVDEEDAVTAPPASPPASSGSSSGSGSSSSSSSTAQVPQPGSKEYMAWFAYNGAKGTYNPRYLEWFNETRGSASYEAWLKAKEAEEEQENLFGGMDFDSSHSPSGWGRSDDDD